MESNDVLPEGLNQTRKKRRMSLEELQTARRRKEALRAKKSALDAAWKFWEKLLVKPGDVIALLSPLSKVTSNSEEAIPSTMLTSMDKNSRISLVFRFWTERDERSRHFLLIPGGVELPESSREIIKQCISDSGSLRSMFRCNMTERTVHLDVLSISLSSVHGGKRGPQKYFPVSSVGVDSTGEPYCVYRFCIVKELQSQSASVLSRVVHSRAFAYSRRDPNLGASRYLFAIFILGWGLRVLYI